jgi:hypothetical protein
MTRNRDLGQTADDVDAITRRSSSKSIHQPPDSSSCLGEGVEESIVVRGRGMTAHQVHHQLEGTDLVVQVMLQFDQPFVARLDVRTQLGDEEGGLTTRHDAISR